MGGATSASHERHPGAASRLAHHFDTPAQQFQAGTLGMWLFLGTELLMFGGLFVVYITLRANYPEIFAYGASHLDRTFGFLNTMVLIFSSFTMAMAVRAAQCNQRRQLVLFLTLTLICGVDFLAVKYIEYSHKFAEHLVWGAGFSAGHDAEFAAGPVVVGPGDAAKGRERFVATCTACHGSEAQGMEKLGPALRQNQFVQSLDDPGLVTFLRAGREVDDPRNTTGLLMPAKGGNSLLRDQDLADIVAHLRTLQPARAGKVAAPSAPVVAALPKSDPANEMFQSVIPAAAAAPAGLARPHKAEAGRAPPNAHLFFAIYFCMTGLHGIHVLVGVGILAWIRARAVKGDFGSGYFTPVDLAGLYWHLVDVIWIFLFPLFYLI